MVRSSLRHGSLAAFATLAVLAGCDREPLEVSPDVDLAKFQGRWHDVAHLARATQADCIGTTATYARKPDGTLSVVHECTLTNGRYHGATATARVVDPKTPAKMSIDFGGYVGDYWIVEVASDYRYAIVGHPSRDYLWILSRTPTMDPADLQTALSHAKDKSFDVSRLEYTPTGPEPQGKPAPPVSYGCSASPATSTPAFGAFAASVAFGMLVVLRRRTRRGDHSAASAQQRNPVE